MRIVDQRVEPDGSLHATLALDDDEWTAPPDPRREYRMSIYGVVRSAHSHGDVRVIDEVELRGMLLRLEPLR